mmetsp:Transcript_26920/g.57059  ORF Transcript_26920/g.57059 Transcript_26920/m.57059 type:complete len:105 (+) Transcript_26920:144-458(+)
MLPSALYSRRLSPIPPTPVMVNPLGNPLGRRPCLLRRSGKAWVSALARDFEMVSGEALCKEAGMWSGTVQAPLALPVQALLPPSLSTAEATESCVAVAIVVSGL